MSLGTDVNGWKLENWTNFSCLPLVSWKRQQEMTLSKKLKTNSNKKKSKERKEKKRNENKANGSQSTSKTLRPSL